MNPRGVEIMREALEPAEKYDPEEVLEKLAFAIVTARNALDRAVMP